METDPNNDAFKSAPDNNAGAPANKDSAVPKKLSLQERTHHELSTHPKYKAYFARFHSYSIENFIRKYAEDKEEFVTHARTYQDYAESSLSGYHSLAEDHFWEIQQKKLFDLQCLWRAGQIRLPGVEITHDFFQWQYNIQGCPFLEPVSEEDVDLYVQFLLSGEMDEYREEVSWQDYDEITAAYQDQENGDEHHVIPDWYQFYNVYRGTASLMGLPDLKGEKEDFYRHLFLDKEKRDAIANGTYQETREETSLPHLSGYDEEQVEDFIRTFETKRELKLYRNYRSYQLRAEKMDEVKQALETLEDAPEHYPLVPHANWKQSLILTARQFEISRIAQALREVHGQYQLKQQLGMKQTGKFKDMTPPFIVEFRESVLNGRELNGEPRNFDY